LPVVVAVTVTVTVHVPPLGGIVPPLKPTLPPPGAAATVPPQVVAALLGVAIVKPLGKVSVKAAPVAAPVPVLPSVMVSVDVPVEVTELGENALLTVTAACAPAAASIRNRAIQTDDNTRILSDAKALLKQRKR